MTNVPTNPRGDILAYVVQHPGAMIYDIADRVNTHWQTVRNHLNYLERSGLVTWELVCTGKKREHAYTATDAGRAADPDDLMQTYHRHPKRGPYKNPQCEWTHKGGTLEQRLLNIYVAAYKRGDLLNGDTAAWLERTGRV